MKKRIFRITASVILPALTAAALLVSAEDPAQMEYIYEDPVIRSCSRFSVEQNVFDVNADAEWIGFSSNFCHYRTQAACLSIYSGAGGAISQEIAVDAPAVSNTYNTGPKPSQLVYSAAELTVGHDGYGLGCVYYICE